MKSISDLKDRTPDPETETLREAAGALLMGDPRYMAGLAAYPVAFLNAVHRELLEAVAVPLRETNRLEDVLDALEHAGRDALVERLLALTADDARASGWRASHVQPMSPAPELKVMAILRRYWRCADSLPDDPPWTEPHVDDGANAATDEALLVSGLDRETQIRVAALALTLGGHVIRRRCA